jgi:hypothetical protein
MNLDKNERILLVEIYEYSEMGGITIKEMNNMKNLKQKIDYPKFFDIIDKLKNLNLIKEIPNQEEIGCPRYTITKEGIKELENSKVKLEDKIDLMESLPSEIFLKYRIENVELTIIMGILLGITYFLLIKNLLILNVVLQIVSIMLAIFFWMGFIINFGEVMIIPLFRGLSNIIKLTKRNKKRIIIVLVIIGFILGVVIFYYLYPKQFITYLLGSGLTLLGKISWDLIKKKLSHKKD